MVTEEGLREFSAQLVGRYRRQRIILFGSQANGSPREDSDVDMLVVMPYQGNALRQAASMVRDIRTPFAVDLIVRTPEEIIERVALNDPFIVGILETGRVMYAAADQ